MLARKSQIEGEVLKYAIIAIAVLLLLILSYKGIVSIQDKNCKSELTLFKIDLEESIKSLSSQQGSMDKKMYDVPCGAEKIFFASKNHVFNYSKLANYPIVKNSLETGGNDNIFLIKRGQLLLSSFVEELEVNRPFLLCLTPKGNKFVFYIEGQSPYSTVRFINKNDTCPDIGFDYSVVEEVPETPEEIILTKSTALCEDTDSLGKLGKRIFPGLDIDTLKLQFKQKCDSSKDKYDIDVSIKKIGENSKVTIKINAYNDLNKFGLIQLIEKSCLDELEEDKFEAGNPDYLITDPIMMWSLGTVGNADSKIIEYILKDIDLTKEICRDALKTIGIEEILPPGAAFP